MPVRVRPASIFLIKIRRMKMNEPFSALNLFKQSGIKFKTKRQASKYLNHYGRVWKEEHNIDLSAPKRGSK